MKKYVMLYTFTAAAILSIVLAGQSVKNSMDRVITVKAVPSTVEDTITCTGRVESFPGNNIYATKPGVVQKIYVQPGDKVSAGQAIMDILPTSSDHSASSSAAPDYSKAYEAYAAYLLKSQSSTSESSGVQSGVPYSNESSSAVYTLKTATSGVVDSVSPSSAGSYVSATSPAATIRSANGVQVRLSVNESQVSNLKKGQKVQISGVGFKDSVYSGTIESISGEAKQTILTTGQETVVEVIASVNNPGTDIKPGFTAKARITTSQNSHILSVPYEAVREDPEENEYVFCAVNGKAKKVPIVTGKEFDNGFEVKSGIKANDIVITNPDDVSDGDKVVVVGTMAGGTHD